MRLTSEIDIQLFEKVLRQLDDTNNIIKEWRRFEYQFSSTHNPLGIMFMALHFWREKKSSDLQKPSLFDIYRALQTTNVSKHSICQVCLITTIVIMIQTLYFYTQVQKVTRKIKGTSTILMKKTIPINYVSFIALKIKINSVVC